MGRREEEAPRVAEAVCLDRYSEASMALLEDMEVEDTQLNMAATQVPLVVTVVVTVVVMGMAIISSPCTSSKERRAVEWEALV